jgi:hypothetical protein
MTTVNPALDFERAMQASRSPGLRCQDDTIHLVVLWPVLGRADEICDDVMLMVC